jgi:hypothetical protein
MDSQKRDESRDRRREEALARRVGDALDQLEHRDAGECPNAELIAAYHEKLLKADEIARCENHFAVCGRCRKILAVLAAAVEAPLSEQEVAHLGELTAAARSRVEAARPARRARPIPLDWRGHWLAPALGVAAALAVWFAVRPPWRTTNQSPSDTLIAQAPKSEPPPSAEKRAGEQFSEATPKKNSEKDAATLKDRPAARAQSTNPPTDALARNRFDDNRVVGGIAPSSGDAVSTLRDEKKQKTDLNGAPASGASGGEFGARAAALPALGPAPPPPRAALLAPRPSNPAPASPQAAQAQAAQQAPKVTAPLPAANQRSVIIETGPAASGTGIGAGSGSGNGPVRDRQVLAPPFAADKIAAPPPPPPPQAPMAVSPEPLPQAQARAQATGQAPSDTEKPRSTNQTVVVTEAVPLVDTTNSTLSGAVSNNTVRDLPLNGRDYQALVKLGAKGELPVLVKTPSGTILWRAGMGGKIERSIDAGRTWILQKSPLQEEWLAGAAASDTMCWIVGRKGAIARTIDGGHWKKIAPPRLAFDSSGKYPDWISITVAGAQTATIVASDQRRYATQDGGKTWKAQ